MQASLWIVGPIVVLGLAIGGMVMRVGKRPEPPAEAEEPPAMPSNVESKPARVTREVRPTAQAPITHPARPSPPTPARIQGYSIVYADANGEISDRAIRVIRVYSDGAIYIAAHCQLRRAERTFRADRILSASLDGNLIADPEAHFAEMLPVNQMPDPEHDSVMARVRPGLQALVWIAQADRQISMEEMEILLDYIAARNALAGARYSYVRWDRSKAVAFIDGLRPTHATAAGAVAKMSPTGKERPLWDRFAEKLARDGGEGCSRRATQLRNI